ncbi:tetratricopeptide repeat protein [Aestuariibius sp. 2305UL40-4]|uniref:tetratricopeptide repeat protein n=1 Tax=Aestuariibius violaceus TaxID=3234132 RepID=UPI00345EF873
MDILVLLAQIYIRIDRTRHALLLLHPVLNVRPDHGPAVKLAAEGLSRLGRHDDAAALFSRLPERSDSGSRPLRLLYVRLLARAGRRDEARQLLEAAASGAVVEETQTTFSEEAA